MKKIIAILAFALVVFGAVSCKKDTPRVKFSAETLEDFKGTMWSSNDKASILTFLDWGSRIYNTNTEGKIKTQWVTANDHLSFEDGVVRIDGATSEFNGRAESTKMLGKLDGESLHFFICDSEWNPAEQESIVVYLRRNFDLLSLKFADSLVPEAVDLGELYTESGVKTHVLWAKWNLGANSEEGSGLFYAWGEIEQKPKCGQSNYLYEDNPDELPADRDAASVRLGDGWRMPTSDELSALAATQNSSDFKWTWVESGDIPGWRIQRIAAEPANLSGNSIFLPCAGYIGSFGYHGTEWDIADGFYWTSSIDTSNTEVAMELTMRPQDAANPPCYPHVEWRWYGQTIRPVCDL